MGMRWFPVVGWAERGGGLATGHGNSVPRFHITWGTGPGVVEVFEWRVARSHEATGLVTLRCRHRVNELVTTDGAVTGVAGDMPANRRRSSAGRRAAARSAAIVRVFRPRR